MAPSVPFGSWSLRLKSETLKRRTCGWDRNMSRRRRAGRVGFGVRG